MAVVTIPVMAKARIGHFAEAQILQALGVDMIDESEGGSSYQNTSVNIRAMYPIFRALFKRQRTLTFCISRLKKF
jgi:hypothetical protein